MTRSSRWAVVVTAVVVLAATPLLVRALPVAGAPPTSSAGALLERMRAAWAGPYAGYVESSGSLALPVSDQLDEVASLLGGRTQLRVWWRAADDWRADALSPTGEHSTRTEPDGVWTWDFEDNRVTRTTPAVPGDLRLPQAADALPPQLAARLLSGARATEVSSLPARRVAGRAADGLRLVPDEPLTSIGHVDVWADRVSGIPVRVEVFGRAPGVAALSSTFLDFTPRRPSEQETAFTPPPGSRLRTGTRFDVVEIAGRFATVPPPESLLGLARARVASGLPGIGQYGSGVTRVVVSALPPRLARSLRAQLRVATGATQLPEGWSVSVGPVAVLLTDEGPTGQDWLVTGTVTPAGLAAAARELAATRGGGDGS